MEITAQLIKELRERTGVGPLDCKKALEQHSGNLDAAANYLREKGLATADKKAGRSANEGAVEIYQHHNRRIGVMAEINCETDFVANTDAFKQFARDVVLHIANMAPLYLTREQIPQSEIEAERKIQHNRILEEGKPANVAEKILEGRMEKFFQEIVLMEQTFIKDDKKTIEDLRKEVVAAVKENVVIRRFARFELGEIGDAPKEE